MKAGQVLGAVQAIYDCLAEGGDERHLLDALRTSVGAEHVVMRCSADGDAARTSTCGRLAGIDLGIFDHIAESDDFDAVMRRLRPGPAIRMSSLVPPKEFERNTIYQEIIRPLNGGLASIALHRQGRETVSVVACRSAVTDPDFSDGDLDVMDMLTPHLITASRIARRIADLQHAASSAYRLLDILSEAVVVLDHAFRPIYLNRAAETIAREANGLRISRDGVSATEETENARLQAAIRVAAALDEGRNEDEGTALAQMRLAISNAPAQSPFIVSVVPAGAVPGEMRDGRASAILLITGPEKTCELSPAAMRTRYRLTQREAELTARLCRGDRLAEAASHLGISVGTARQYLKAIFEKTGVNRQIDLVRLVRQA
ncbi:hypothetical protein ATN84_10130 [Paramesorhizobium deserti]|uniref:HTH luxR-type domain-containing protein n=1 Tax=Paramesorhizobium deserti TaxID=1494590 RepID=A0A135HWW6_9HYPH|nr:helix-turn-helix transcriptional regulator [Paramesorhizobium deserti]KXF77687.1 hypothetical protein ATN84_10130 [Paramesorhizobium deserti]